MIQAHNKLELQVLIVESSHPVKIEFVTYKSQTRTTITENEGIAKLIRASLSVQNSTRVYHLWFNSRNRMSTGTIDNVIHWRLFTTSLCKFKYWHVNGEWAVKVRLPRSSAHESYVTFPPAGCLTSEAWRVQLSPVSNCTVVLKSVVQIHRPCMVYHCRTDETNRF